MTQTHAVPIRPAYRAPAVVTAFLVTAIVLLTLDLALKYWAFSVWPDSPVDIAQVVANEASLPGIEKTIVPNGLALRLTLNRGAVFGIGQGQVGLFTLVTIAAVGVIGYLFAASKAHQHLLHLVMAMILAGALGNLYDRMAYGAVRDMLWLFPGVNLPFDWSWPGGLRELYPWIFNPADVYLVCGIGLLIVRTLIPQRPPEPEPVKAPVSDEQASTPEP